MQAELDDIGTLKTTALWGSLWVKVQLQQAHVLLDGVTTEMAQYWDERSEAWQSSERGEQFTERLESMEELLAQLQELAEA